MASATMDSARGRKVLMGTCGWSDQTLLRCGKFYPASVRSAEDRLRHYSSHFPCVEVDTSTYAIPSPVTIGRWVNAVTPGFLFHFKAFGLFCSKSGAVSTIPGRIRSNLVLSDDQHVKLYDLPSDFRDELWNIFNSALQPAYQAGHLGVVVFQFHLSFKPSNENHAHVLWCRKNLDSRYSMAVEFRCRDWFIGEQMSKTETWLASNSLVLIAADELQHETYQRDREQTGLAPGQLRVVLPIAWPSTHPDFLYIRIHRREGTQRLLSDEELQSWEMRLGPQLPPGLKGPIYFMWGTDWEDQPLINAKRLAQRLPKELAFDWKAINKTTNNRLQSMFMAVSSKVQPSSNIDQSQKQAEDVTSGGTEIPEDISNRRNSSALIGEEPSRQMPSSDQFADEHQSSPCTALPSLELPLSPKVSDDEITCDEKPEGKPIEKDVVSQKQVGPLDPLPQVDGADVSLSLKSVSGKACECSPLKQASKEASPPKKSQIVISTQPAEVHGANVSLSVKSAKKAERELSPLKQLSKKTNPTKKSRTVTSTPTITSFFKRATPTDL